MGMGGQRHAPDALPLGKNRYPLYRRLGGPQDVLLEYNESIFLTDFKHHLITPHYYKFKNLTIVFTHIL